MANAECSATSNPGTAGVTAVPTDIDKTSTTSIKIYFNPVQFFVKQNDDRDKQISEWYS